MSARGLFRPKASGAPFLHQICRAAEARGAVQAFDTGPSSDSVLLLASKRLLPLWPEWFSKPRFFWLERKWTRVPEICWPFTCNQSSVYFCSLTKEMKATSVAAKGNFWHPAILWLPLSRDGCHLCKLFCFWSKQNNSVCHWLELMFKDLAVKVTVSSPLINSRVKRVLLMKERWTLICAQASARLIVLKLMPFGLHLVPCCGQAFSAWLLWAVSSVCGRDKFFLASPASIPFLCLLLERSCHQFSTHSATEGISIIVFSIFSDSWKDDWSEASKVDACHRAHCQHTT